MASRTDLDVICQPLYADTINRADRNYSRDIEREPTVRYSGARTFRGAPVRRCLTCSIPMRGQQATGRCPTCIERNARAVTCGCGFLYEDESCTCCAVDVNHVTIETMCVAEAES